MRQLAYKMVEGAILEYWRGLSFIHRKTNNRFRTMSMANDPQYSKGIPVVERMRDAAQFLDSQDLDRWCHWIGISPDEVRQYTLIKPPQKVFEQKKFKRMEAIDRAGAETDCIIASGEGDSLGGLGDDAGVIRRETSAGREAMTLQEFIAYMKVRQEYRTSKDLDLTAENIHKVYNIPFKVPTFRIPQNGEKTVSLPVHFRPLRGKVLRSRVVEARYLGDGLAVMQTPTFNQYSGILNHAHSWCLLHVKSGLMITKAGTEEGIRCIAEEAKLHRDWTTALPEILCSVLAERAKKTGDFSISMKQMQEIEDAYSTEPTKPRDVHNYLLIDSSRKSTNKVSELRARSSECC